MWWYWPSSWNRCRYWWSLWWSPATCTGHREFTFWFSLGPPSVGTLKKPTFISSGNWTIPRQHSTTWIVAKIFAEIIFRIFAAKLVCKIYRKKWRYISGKCQCLDDFYEKRKRNFVKFSQYRRNLTFSQKWKKCIFVSTLV